MGDPTPPEMVTATDSDVGSPMRMGSYNLRHRF